MLTCLEIINILYMKCNDLCNSLKFKFDSVFNDNRNRPYRYHNNFNNNYNNYNNYVAKYNKDVIIDMDKQIVLETVSGPIILNNKENDIIPSCNLATIDEETTLETFTFESKIEGDKSGDWSIIMDDNS